ncbi:UDP-N-acetylmuramoyl-L-alanine--D-glutamate ligase [Flavobacteriaceae bacterium]|nr:UDP-N-acetylmuramoyl-L-alanine--D-glutamate ligase [Flavobacteriaceae bacterium]
MLSPGSHIVVLGAGESGVGAAILAKKKGFEVFVSDRSNIASKYKEQLVKCSIVFEEGTHTVDKILHADLVIKSPGIPDNAPLVQELLNNGVSVISEIEWGYYFLEGGEIIAITGTNGKTTTATLTHHILKSVNSNILLAGNIGDSFAAAVAEQPEASYVLEVSSFQLDGIDQFRPHISVLTNITPDHLDRYDYSFKNYIGSKMRIVKNQNAEDFFIYDTDDEVIAKEVESRLDEIAARLIPFSCEKKLNEGAFLEGDFLKIIIDNQTFTMETSKIPIQGKHNLKNTMAASTVAMIKNIRREAIKQSIEGFTGVAHRMEVFEEYSGVRFINDSKATNVNATYFALESVKRPVIWIAGGVDKGNDYSALMPLVREKVKAILCIGIDNQKIIDTFGKVVSEIYELSTLEDTVALAMRFAERGDTVILSPACASFDRFKNYEDRGEQFKKVVRSLD